ncbi:MAG: hypothetical protein H0U70_13165 [Tatlockia sp.]|nr:hypothetical protein [Tatlockia sp.]
MNLRFKLVNFFITLPLAFSCFASNIPLICPDENTLKVVWSKVGTPGGSNVPASLPGIGAFRFEFFVNLTRSPSEWTGAGISDFSRFGGRLFCFYTFTTIYTDSRSYKKTGVYWSENPISDNSRCGAGGERVARREQCTFLDLY